MDLVALHVLSNLVSAAVQMIATLVVLFCVVSFLSLKPGSSLRFAFISLFYFFSLTIALFLGAVLLDGISLPTYRVGVVSLLEAALIHLGYGALVSLLYVRNLISQRRF